MSTFDDIRLSRDLTTARHEGRLMAIAEIATARLLQAKPDCIVAQGLRRRCLDAQAEAAAARAEHDREFEALCKLRFPTITPPLAPVEGGA